ncbi:hypothetical protein KUR91_004791 [Escherichia coli]|uniref:hypothetical protein n=1 Tax=Escherichia coli TaxID=562 RepID=UPI000A6B1A06|nr:hypothetical protein [Escherichia coli]EEV7801395.1 hypothetical protein [Escherichia coli]EFA6871660.1 hypothetical protein [Escherichia coli]EFB5249095.1 hypothetical protein [Escherichia coli]EFC0794628.1 hypothetical protein [Escherichia coli]EFC0900975.1 hypothetical protein [Escherichia coli]
MSNRLCGQCAGSVTKGWKLRATQINGLHELFLEFDEAVWKGEEAIPLMSLENICQSCCWKY